MFKSRSLIVAMVMVCFGIMAINSNSVFADQDINRVIQLQNQSKRIVRNSVMPVEDIDRVVRKLNRSRRILRNRVLLRLNPPKTGQTICYDETGTVIACAGTGQDGDLQMGAPSPDPRFTDNGDGTVTDNQTKLIWLQDANCIAMNYPEFDNDAGAGDGAVTWQYALDFVAGINNETYPDCGAGYTDWRLPNVRELYSPIDYGQYNPALPSGHPFTNVQSINYWSSTTYESYTHSVWLVGIDSGSVASHNKAYSHHVWPVRAGN